MSGGKWSGSLVLTGAVAGEMRRHFSRDTTLWGPRLALSLSGGLWQVTLDAGVAASRDDVSIGELSILMASGTLFAGPRLALGPVLASVGPAATFGWARIKGQSEMSGVIPISGSNTIATLGLRVAAEAPAAMILRLLAYVEAGWTVRWFDAEVNGQPTAGIAGFYLLLGAGVRFGPS